MIMNKEEVKRILQSEIRRHYKEIERHGQLFKQTKSKQQKRKLKKHFDKKFQTINIAKELGFEYCEYCGALK